MGLENVTAAVISDAELGGDNGLPDGYVPVEASGPYVVTIVGLVDDPTVPLVVRLPINPESWDRSLAQSWSPRNAPGVRTDRLDWTGNPPATTRFTSLLQVDVGRELEARVLKPLEGWREQLQQSSQEPPAAIISFGVHQYRVVLTDVSIKRIRTDANGDATIAEVSISALDQAK